MIGHDEFAREREERIEKVKVELFELRSNFEKLEIAHESLQINHSKVLEQYDTAANDLKDTVEKLNIIHKVQHETEIRLGEEIEKTRALQDIVRLKEESLNKRSADIEDLDKQVIDLQRDKESQIVKCKGLERQIELVRKQFTEKIAS